MNTPVNAERDGDRALSAREAVRKEVPRLPQARRDLGLRPDGRWGRWWQAAVALVGLVLLLPISLAIAIATKLTSRGPIL